MRQSRWFGLAFILTCFFSQVSFAQVPAVKLQRDFQRLLIESPDPFPLGEDKVQRLLVLGETKDGRRFPYAGRVRWISQNQGVSITDTGFVTGNDPGPVTLVVEAVDEKLRGELQTEVVRETIEVFFEVPKNWTSTPHVWAWYLEGAADISGVDPRTGQPFPSRSPASFGSYPGPAMQPVEGRPGWFRAELPRYDNTSEFPGVPLKSQPVRLMFSNTANGEKTRDFARYDGCFYSYNRYLRGSVIDGRWDSPNNCPAFARSFRAQAEPRGGPVFGDQGFMDLEVRGAAPSTAKFTMDGQAANDTRGYDFESGKTNVILDRSHFTDSGFATVCLFAENGDRTHQQCLDTYQAADNVKRYKGLGAHYEADATTFAIWSPDRNSVEVWLDGATYPLGYIGEKIGKPGVWAVTIPGDFKNKRYKFILDDAMVRDPYAKMVEAGTDYAIVMDVAHIQPEGGWAPTPKLVKREDSIIYEMSIRDFTFDASSGVTPELRGKFLGSVEKGAYLNKQGSNGRPDIKTSIDHLKELGVTHVQLMPIYDYATCSAKDIRNGPNCYNWGYDPENFNVPEERYSSRPDDPEFRVREFQTVVNEFHKAGIRVILDVVYNHTWVRPWREADEGEKYFGDITGKYFLFDQDGIGYQLTGTGNTIDPKDPMVFQYIQDSLEYWVRTYNVDGFRFDVAGVFDYDELTRWTTHLYDQFPEKNLLAYGEPYTALADPDPNHFRLDRIGTMTRADGKASDFGGFNFSYREAIKGSNDNGYGGGFAFNDSFNGLTLINGLRGSLGWGDVPHSAFASDPVQTINYATSHDNLNLADKINAWAALQPFPVSLDYKKRIQAFANAIVLVSQGIPFLHYGEEFMRTKAGIHDSYQAGDSVNKVDWSKKAQFKDLNDYYSQLIGIRKSLGSLRLGTRAEIDQRLSLRWITNGLLEMHISASAEHPETLVLLNSGPEREYNLPYGTWTLLLEGNTKTVARPVEGRVMAGGTAATILTR